MALPLVRIDPHVVVHPRRPTATGRIASMACLVDLVGRVLVLSFGVAVLLVTGSGAASLAVIGVLAIGSALVSWSE